MEKFDFWYERFQKGSFILDTNPYKISGLDWMYNNLVEGGVEKDGNMLVFIEEMVQRRGIHLLQHRGRGLLHWRLHPPNLHLRLPSFTPALDVG